MFLASVGWVKTQQNIKVVWRLFQTTLPYTLTLTCFVYNENGQHQWKVPSKEENARNGLPETDWRDAQYDMLYLSVTESIRFHYDRTGNLIHRELVDCEVQNYFYDRHDQLVKAEIFKKDGTKLLEIP